MLLWYSLSSERHKSFSLFLSLFSGSAVNCNRKPLGFGFCLIRPSLSFAVLMPHLNLYLLPFVPLHKYFVCICLLKNKVLLDGERKIFFLFCPVWSENFVSIMDIDVIIRSYFVQSIGTKSSNNESSKENSKDKRLWTDEENKQNFFTGAADEVMWFHWHSAYFSRKLSDFVCCTFALKWHYFQWIRSKLWYPIRVMKSFIRLLQADLWYEDFFSNTKKLGWKSYKKTLLFVLIDSFLEFLIISHEKYNWNFSLISSEDMISLLWNIRISYCMRQ